MALEYLGRKLTHNIIQLVKLNRKKVENCRKL